MKQRDIVRVIGQTLLTRFAMTGERNLLVTVDLSRGATFSVEPYGENGSPAMEVSCKLHAYATPIMIEAFASERMAWAAFERINHAISRGATARRLAGGIRGLVKYGVMPLGVLLIGLAMNVAVHPGFGRGPVMAAPTNLPVPLPEQTPMPAAAAAQSAGPSAKQIAQALSQGAASKKYAVQLGAGGKGILYVFEDPQCPHCQAFAPELDKLAKDHTVYVFPVSVIGGQQSALESAAVLCEADGTKRLAAWTKAQTQGLAVKNVAARCETAVSANDDIFRVMGLQGTPTVISGDGRVMPYDVPAESSAVASWLAGAK
jgi:TrbB protein